MKYIAIVPARGGSKGIPRKNIKLLNGKPLIEYTLNFLKEINFINEIIVTTDSEEIKDIVEKNSISVPVLRPSHLAEDYVSDFPVIKHALAKLTTNKADIVLFLRPTIPFRSYETVNEMVEKLVKDNIDSVRTVKKVSEHPYWMKVNENGKWRDLIEGRNENKYYQRQMLPDVYTLSGAVDVFWAKNIEKYGNLYGDKIEYHIDKCEYSVDIDTMADWYEAEYLLKEGLVNE